MRIEALQIVSVGVSELILIPSNPFADFYILVSLFEQSEETVIALGAVLWIIQQLLQAFVSTVQAPDVYRAKPELLTSLLEAEWWIPYICSLSQPAASSGAGSTDSMETRS
jgi:hypothetical protein